MNDNSKPIKVCMMSYVHDLYDDRIYWKESIALSKNGFDVCCIGVTETPINEVSKQGIRLVGIPKTTKSNFKGKLELLFSSKSIFNQLLNIAEKERANVYHIHDFQLNKIGPALKRLSHHPRVIYDVHEPYPVTLTTIEEGNLIRSIKMRIMRYALRYWEKRMAAEYDLIISTEDNVAEKFSNYFPNKAVSVIWNYSDLKRVEDAEVIYDFIYCGGLMGRRGAFEMLKSINTLKKRGFNIKLLIIGSIFSEELKVKMDLFIKENQLMENITILPHVPYHKIAVYYSQSRFALALFKDVEVNRIIMPIKIFEYITMNLPVICSNFGHLNRITSSYETGLTVNADDVVDVSYAMERLLTDAELASRLKENCKKAAASFNWDKMRLKLVNLYDNLL